MDDTQTTTITTIEARSQTGFRRSAATMLLAIGLLIGGGVAAVNAATPDPSASPTPSASTGTESEGATPSDDAGDSTRGDCPEKEDADSSGSTS